MNIIIVSKSFIFFKKCNEDKIEFYNINNLENYLYIPSNNNTKIIEYNNTTLYNIGSSIQNKTKNNLTKIIEGIVVKIIQSISEEEIIIFNKDMATSYTSKTKEILFDKRILDFKFVNSMIGVKNTEHKLLDFIGEYELIPPYKIISHYDKLCKNMYSNLKYIQYFKKHKYFSTINEYIYGIYKIKDNGIFYNNSLQYLEYDFNSANGRPKIKDSGFINFNNVSKKDSLSRHIRSRFPGGKIVEIDYRGYSVNILSKLIGYEFPKNSYCYNILGKHILNQSTNLEECEITEIKKMTFEVLFGNSNKYDGINNIVFFKKIIDFKNDMWRSYNNNNIIPIVEKTSSYKISNPGILLNFIYTGMETIYNILVLDEIMRMIEDKKLNSKIILYKYDSIVFDFDMDEYDDNIEEISQIVALNGTYRISKGDDYTTMIF